MFDVCISPNNRHPSASLVIPILPITRQQFPPRITRRDRSLQFFKFGFEKMVCDDQRLDRFTRIDAEAR
jgi:hypothetical protein